MFECPDCGFPSHCTEEHWAEDAEHGKYCDRLREANEDEHDLRSGRKITEFEFNSKLASFPLRSVIDGLTLSFLAFQAWDEAVSFSSWDLFWYTRSFKSIDSERSRRHATKVLTYPITIAAILHEHSPHSMRNQRITNEGARVLAGESLSTQCHCPNN